MLVIRHYNYTSQQLLTNLTINGRIVKIKNSNSGILQLYIVLKSNEKFAYEKFKYLMVKSLYFD